MAERLLFDALDKQVYLRRKAKDAEIVGVWMMVAGVALRAIALQTERLEETFLGIGVIIVGGVATLTGATGRMYREKKIREIKEQLGRGSPINHG